ncbi:hypothetical protein Tco_0735434 [Tanacetum coccineum]
MSFRLLILLTGNLGTFDSIISFVYPIRLFVTLGVRLNRLNRGSFECCGKWTGCQEEDVMVCHEKVVRIPLEGDETRRVHGEQEKHEVHLKLVLELQRKEKLYAKFTKSEVRQMLGIDALRRGKERTSGQRDMTFYTLGDMIGTHVLERIYVTYVRNVEFCFKRFRWMIYLMVLADAAESVSDAIRFEYCLASSSGWTKPKAARDHQKAMLIMGVNPVRVEVGDRVLLKVTPWKGVVHFGKKSKLAPRYVGSFGILERIGLVYWASHFEYVCVGSMRITFVPFSDIWKGKMDIHLYCAGNGYSRKGTKRKPKSKQIQAQGGKSKVKSQAN